MKHLLRAFFLLHVPILLASEPLQMPIAQIEQPQSSKLQNPCKELKELVRKERFAEAMELLRRDYNGLAQGENCPQRKLYYQRKSFYKYLKSQNFKMQIDSQFWFYSRDTNELDYLLFNGEDINRVNDKGATKFHWTTRIGVKQFLLERGANPHQRTISSPQMPSGFNVLEAQIQNQCISTHFPTQKNIEFLRELKLQGVSISAVAPTGHYWVNFCRNPDILRLLHLEWGFPQQKDSLGRSTLDIHLQNHHWKAAAIFDPYKTNRVQNDWKIQREKERRWREVKEFPWITTGAYLTWVGASSYLSNHSKLKCKKSKVPF